MVIDLVTAKSELDLLEHFHEESGDGGVDEEEQNDGRRDGAIASDPSLSGLNHEPDH